MIFRPELAAKIKSGEKTQTRRALKPYVEPDPSAKPRIVIRAGAKRRAVPKAATIAGERYVACRYQVGHTYAVQPGRGKAEIARIRITEVRHEPLGAITPEGAKAEGFRRKAFGDVPAFFDYWLGLHGEIEKNALVWVISFELERDDTLFLAPATPGRPDYTRDRHRALSDEDPSSGKPLPMSAVDPDTLNDFAKDNRARFEAARGDEVRHRDLRSSVERLKRLAKTHRDSSVAAQIIARHVEEIERELEGRRAA